MHLDCRRILLPACIRAAVLGYVNLKRPVDQIGLAHSPIRGFAEPIDIMCLLPIAFVIMYLDSYFFVVSLTKYSDISFNKLGYG